VSLAAFQFPAKNSVPPSLFEPEVTPRVSREWQRRGSLGEPLSGLRKGSRGDNRKSLRRELAISESGEQYHFSVNCARARARSLLVDKRDKTAGERASSDRDARDAAGRTDGRTDVRVRRIAKLRPANEEAITRGEPRAGSPSRDGGASTPKRCYRRVKGRKKGP